MATVNKDFKIKQGLIVEGQTGKINNFDILTKKQDDQDYIIDLIGGETLVKSVSGNLSVDGAGDLSINETGLATDLAGSYLGANDGVLDVDIEGIADDLIANADFATTTDISTALNDYTPTASLDALIGTAPGGFGYLKNADLPTMYSDSDVDAHLSGTHPIEYNAGAISLDIDATGGITNDEGGIRINRTTVDGWYEASGAVSTHNDLTTGVHGVTGDVVGTTDTQDISNKRIIDTLYFSDGITIAEEGEIAVRAVTHDFDVQANYGDLHLKTVHTDGTTGSDVQITSTYGDILLNAAGTAYYGSASAENEIATHGYVDNAISGLDWKQAVHLLYDAAIPVLSGSGATQLIVDGHDPLGDADSGYRLLLTGATSPGIYVYNSTEGSWTLTRAEDADVFGELIGAAVYVMEGNQYGSTSWVQGNHYLTDFTGQTWTQFSGQGSVTAGEGITVNGLEVLIDRTTVDDWYDAYGSAAAITPTSLGLGNVDNTSDANKPISSATQTALDSKADAANPTLTGSLTLDGSGDFTITSDSNIVLDANTTSYLGSATSGNEIATKSYVDNAVDNVTIDLSTAAGANIDWNAGTSQFDVNVSDVITNGGIATETYVSTNYVSSAGLDAAVAAEGYAKTVDVPTSTDDLTEGTAQFFTDQKALDAVANASSVSVQALDITWVRREEATYTDVNTASTVTVHSFGTNKGSVKYLVRVFNAGHSHVSEVLVTTDSDNNIAILEYGTIYTSTNPLATITAAWNGTTSKYDLNVTTANSNSEVLVAATLISYND